MSNCFNPRYCFLVRPGMSIGLLKRGNRNPGLQRLMFGQFYKNVDAMREAYKGQRILEDYGEEAYAEWLEGKQVEKQEKAREKERENVVPLSKQEYAVMCRLQDDVTKSEKESEQLKGLEERYRLTDGMVD